jgi:hypothetical protein
MLYRLKDSDVTWLYGPLHEAPHGPVPPKGASLEDKLNIIPPLPKGRKPILKKRTLAEVLVLGLAKTNNLPITPTRAHADPDELKELDIDSRGTTGPEQRDRIMLLHTKSDTNLLRPAISRVHYSNPSSPVEVPTPRRPSMRTRDRSHLSNSTNTGSVSPPPMDENGPRKRVGFNAYVSQCIAIAPGERDTSDDDGDALSMKSGGSGNGKQRQISFSSRSHSHSSARSEPLIIAPMAPALLKETLGDNETSDAPALIYKPIGTPFDSSDSDDDSDEPDVPIIKPPKISSIDRTEDADADLGGDYNILNKKRKLSSGEIPPAIRSRKALDADSPPTSVLAPSGTTVVTSSSPPGTITLPTETAISDGSTSDDSRGRTLQRTSSGSSLNERSRSRNGGSPMGSRSPESSRASSSSNPRGPAETSLTVRATESSRGDTESVEDKPADGDLKGTSVSTPKQEAPTPGLVDKAAATARGFIGTLLNAPSMGSNKRTSA